MICCSSIFKIYFVPNFLHCLVNIISNLCLNCPWTSKINKNVQSFLLLPIAFPECVPSSRHNQFSNSAHCDIGRGSDEDKTTQSKVRLLYNKWLFWLVCAASISISVTEWADIKRYFTDYKAHLINGHTHNIFYNVKKEKSHITQSFSGRLFRKIVKIIVV